MDSKLGVDDAAEGELFQLAQVLQGKREQLKSGDVQLEV